MQKLLHFLANFDVFYDPFQTSSTTSRFFFEIITNNAKDTKYNESVLAYFVIGSPFLWKSVVFMLYSENLVGLELLKVIPYLSDVTIVDL